MKFEEYLEKFDEKQKPVVTGIYRDFIYPLHIELEKMEKKIKVLEGRNPSVISHAHSSDDINDGVTIVDYYGEWCMPCYDLLPSIENVAKQMEGKVTFLKVNVDEEKHLAEKANISSIPLLVLYRDGEEIQRLVGCPSDEKKRVDSIRFLAQRGLVNQDEWNKTLEVMEKIANSKGWFLNPDVATRDGIISALTWNKENHGKYYCPCKPEHTAENVCPCRPYGYYVGSKKRIEDEDECYCGLFVSKGYVDEYNKIMNKTG